MPQCPHCRTEYDSGQRYCQMCGSFLLHPEVGDTFCPECGIRVSPRQEFCHECDAPLKERPVAAPAPMEQPAPGGPAAAAPAATPAKGSQMMVGLLVGAGIIILLLLILVFSRSDQPAPPAPQPPPKTEAPAPPAAPPTPPAAAPAPAPPAPAPEAKPADLKEQLQGILAKMREARLNKDIILLMNCYSLTYPDVESKRREALKAWENYDYTNMVFTLDEVQPLDADNANAKITWYVDLRNRRTGELISSTQTFQVRFAKELGQWRIRSLEEAE